MAGSTHSLAYIRRNSDFVNARAFIQQMVYDVVLLHKKKHDLHVPLFVILSLTKLRTKYSPAHKSLISFLKHQVGANCVRRYLIFLLERNTVKHVPGCDNE